MCGELKRASFLTLKLVLCEKNDQLTDIFLLKQNFIGYQNLHYNMDENEFENITCKVVVDDAQHFVCLSSNSQSTPLKFQKLYSTLAEFNFKPLREQLYDTFETTVKICLMDKNNDCVVCLKKRIKIEGEY